MKLYNVGLDHTYALLLSAMAFTIPLPMLANNISIFMLIVYWLFLCFKKQIKITQLKHILLLSIPYLVVALGAIYSTNHKQLIVEMTKNLPFLLLPIIFCSMPLNISAPRFKMIWNAFLASNFIIATILIFVIVKTLIRNGFSTESLWGVTHQKLSDVVGLNAIYLSLYLALCLLYIVYVFLYENKALKFKTNFIYRGFFVLFFVCMVFLSSRTVILSCGIIATGLIFHYHSKKGSAFKVVSNIVLLGAVILIFAFTVNPIFKMRVDSLFQVGHYGDLTLKEEGVQMRQKLWESSYEVFKDNIIFGVGTGDFKDKLLETYKRKKYRVQYRFEMNSHNQYLSYLVFSGICGTILFLLYLGYPMFRYAKEKNWLLLSVVAMFALCFLTESYLYTNKGVIVVSFFMTFMYKHALDSKLQS